MSHPAGTEVVWYAIIIVPETKVAVNVPRVLVTAILSG